MTEQLLGGLDGQLKAAGLPELPISRADLAKRTRRVFRTRATGRPCLPDASCAAVPFTFATLPIRPFSSGHTWFNQGVQEMEGHDLPQHAPVNVHFTFQFGDTPKYPHGKRQRAREAGLWAVDPPEYFTQGVYVALRGPAYSEAEQAASRAPPPPCAEPRTRHARATHAPGTRHARATHAPRTRHARATHAPHTHHTHTTHTPRVCHASMYRGATCHLPLTAC